MYNDLIDKEPKADRYIRKFIGGRELLNGHPRHCLWLVNIEPKELRSMPLVLKQVENVKQFRLSSKKKATRLSADTPTLFQEIRQTDDNYIAIPEVSTSTRKYIPMGFMDKETIASNKIQMITNANLLEFGILESSVHMAWVRVVAGRLGMGFDYSSKIVYNNFPWITPTDKQKEKIEKTAQAILDARKNHPKSSLADLYDPLTMPADLLKAHKANDKAVLQAYNLSADATESEIVAHLFKMYGQLTKTK